MPADLALSPALTPAPAPSSIWDPDSPPPPFPRRLLRAAAVAAAWLLSAAPVLAGIQTCTVARLLHRPCPGCGMTRALHLLVDGDVSGSLRMHPLAVPVLLVGLLFMGSTVVTTLRLGSPLTVYRTRSGRWIIGAMVVVYGATLIVWTLRWFGFLGGPVPVF